MVAVTADKVIVELEARLDQYNVRVNGARQNFQRSMRDIGRHGTQAERLTRRNFGGMASAIAAVEGPLGGTAARFRSFNAVLRDVGPAAAAGAIGIGALAIGLTQVTQLADKFTRFENRLKTAGLEGENLARTGDRLFDIANRNGVEIEALGSVYARASLAADELGASEGQLDVFVNAVSNALRVQGSSAEASRGALLQLSQALGQDIVRGEEFNSILEGALPIAQAAARGIERFEGSVAKLRTAIINGEVTSREFFEGILRGAPQLALQAAKANLTLENSFTALYNQLARGIGTTDKALGATEKLSQGIIFLANNLDSVGAALAIITSALGARLVTALGRAATEQASYYAQVARGNVVILGGARASEQRAAATVTAAKADEQAAASALAKARAAQQSAVVSSTDANAQYQRAAATRQLTILEEQATAATARRIAAEQAHAAALTRTTVAARAAAVATRAYAALSGVLGGPLGIALTAIAGTYLIVSNRTAAAAERTRDLQAELRELGYLAEEAEGALDGTAKKLEELADDEIRRKIQETKDVLDSLRRSGPLDAIFGPLFDPDSLQLDQVEFFAKQFRTNINPEIRDAGAEIERLVEGIDQGTITAEELDKQLADLAARDLGIGVDNLLASLREIGPTILAAQPHLENMQRQLEEMGIGDPRADMMRRRARLRQEQTGREDFFAERERLLLMDEQERAIEKRADALEKEAEKQGIVLSREQALVRARREVTKEASDKEAERLAKLAEQDAQVLADLQRAIQTFGDERQQAIDRAVGSLSESASAAEIERVKQLAGDLYDLAEARRIDAIINSEAKDEAIQGLRDEAAQLGVVGGALVQLQFEQKRLNELRAEGIEITPQLIEQIRQEGEAVRQVYEEIEKKNEPLRNQIEINDAVRQGFIDIGRAGVEGFDSLGDAVSRALTNISQMILEMYVLKPLVEDLLGPMGKTGSGALGGILGGLFSSSSGGAASAPGVQLVDIAPFGSGFSSGTANTGGRRGEPRGVVHGQEAVIPLPAGGKVPVELRMPEMNMRAGGGGMGNVSVNTNVYVTRDGAQSSTTTSGDQEQSARRLASLVEQNTRATIQREMRQGGLLWNGGGRR